MKHGDERLPDNEETGGIVLGGRDAVKKTVLTAVIAVLLLALIRYLIM